jgi:hypothetical protein
MKQLNAFLSHFFQNIQTKKTRGEVLTSPSGRRRRRRRRAAPPASRGRAFRLNIFEKYCDILNVHTRTGIIIIIII